MNKRELVGRLMTDLDPRNEYHRNLEAVFRQVDTDLRNFLLMMHHTPEKFSDLIRTETNEVTINKTEVGVSITEHPGKTRPAKILVNTTFAFNGCLTIEVEPVGQLAKPRSGLRYEEGASKFANQEPKKASDSEPLFTPANDEPQFSLTRSGWADVKAKEIIMTHYFRIVDQYNGFETEEFRPSIGFTDKGFYIVLS